MDYPFESLDPESFQQFCQALLVSELQGVQCFPVAQPDGGRDAVAYLQKAGTLQFAMYQVKFTRKPLAVADPHKWLTTILEKEVSKVAKQIPKGARQFYLLTNVPGTAHPETGSIDALNQLLAEKLEIPAEVWWRDDLSRRLDNAWNLKWAYPQLMTGPDLIRGLVEAGLLEERERRANTIRAFLSDQYAQDEEVKFKQVELQNRLLDLFIDVPVVPPPLPLNRRRSHWFDIYNHVAMNIARRNGSHREVVNDRDRPPIGAATMLLDSLIQEKVPYLVLEGAPGQGKSTITQYVAQVHRMRLLGKTEELAALPEIHQTAPVRLPFKVDLRDLASWLSKRDPFNPNSPEDLPPDWHKSLEGFLAALVRHHSGGSAFSISDLHAVARFSALLFMFDGLDEVADIPRRKEVVQEVVRGLKRLREVTVSLQAVVTSRPAAFANSPGLPEDAFPHFQLDSVTRPLIDKYADKWLDARRLQGREKGAVKRILNEKLNQPHLRDLARNPMQLAILLSLIHTRGSSLPDKRTALYDSYMELFFNREAEKSDIVRDYRDLLVDIHRYVAWVLHSKAEESTSNGSIRSEDLEELLRTYLFQEGHDPAIADLLFLGMVERVVALVSRVEGTFEFEVQPLREYFAARYLYDTAPYSPPGNERGGTKPDRFDALARDFYWLNVTRFYAGCYSKGELPSLVDRLQELMRDEDYSRLAHPRLLAATLLSDWVFAQHPKSMKEVVELVLDGIGLRFLISSGHRRVHSTVPLILPTKTGREQLVEKCRELLRSGVARDFGLDVLDILRANASPEELLASWEAEARAATGMDRTRWLEYGNALGTLSRAPANTVRELLCDGIMGSERISALVTGRRWDILEGDESWFSAVVNASLDRDTEWYPRGHSSRHLVERLTSTMTPYKFAWSLALPEPIPLVELWRRNGMVWQTQEPEEGARSLNYELARKCERVLAVADEQSKILARVWATELAPWDRLIDVIQAEWGDRWLVYEFANYAAGIRSNTETSRECPALFDVGAPLCHRARYARLRAGMPMWWERQLPAAQDEDQRAFWCCLLLCWASPPTLTRLAGAVNDVLNDLSVASWSRLFRAIESAVAVTRDSRGERRARINVSHLPSDLGDRGAAALTLRADQESTTALFEKYLARTHSNDIHVLERCQASALGRLPKGDKPKADLELIRRSYAAGVVSEDYSFELFRRRTGSSNLSADVARLVTNAPQHYPAFLVAASERTLQSEVARTVVPVGKVALRDSWTFS